MKPTNTATTTHEPITGTNIRRGEMPAAFITTSSESPLSLTSA